MKFNELTAKRAKPATRIGRGISAGRGKTAGRGTKGQGSRKSSLKAGFAGGQTPIYMQLPKLRGFKTKKAKPEVVYTGQLDAIKKATVDNQTLAEAGLVTSPHVKVKVVLKGEVKAKKTVKVQAISVKAREAIEKVGGAVEMVAQQARPAKKTIK